jgi:hypothetical protein
MKQAVIPASEVSQESDAVFRFRTRPLIVDFAGMTIKFCNEASILKLIEIVREKHTGQ